MVVPDGIGGEDIYWYHFDGLGSVVALSNNSGSIVEGYMYDAFGKCTVVTSAGTDGNWLTDDGTSDAKSAYGNPYQFTARRWDDETDLYYYRARMYKPEIGRFLQPDPIGYDDGMNMYAYVGNNSINFVDPMGLCKDTNWDKMDFFEKFGEGYYYGTAHAEQGQKYWAGKYVESSGLKKFYYGGGLTFSSMWQPETFKKTLLTIIVAGTANSASQRLVADGPKGTRIFQVRSAMTGKPYFRFDKGPVPGRGTKPHYHRRPDLRKHRPYEGECNV